MGFLAQDIEALLGEKYNVLTIGADTDRILSLRYTDLIAPLVKAVQEQQQTIAQLSRLLEEQKKSNSQLSARLLKLERIAGAEKTQ